MNSVTIPLKKNTASKKYGYSTITPLRHVSYIARLQAWLAGLDVTRNTEAIGDSPADLKKRRLQNVRKSQWNGIYTDRVPEEQ